MDILKLIADLAGNPIVQSILGLLGAGGLYAIIDRTVKKGVKEIFKNERKLLEWIDALDENYIDTLEKNFPQSHKEIEARLLKLCDRIKQKIQD